MCVCVRGIVKERNVSDVLVKVSSSSEPTISTRTRARVQMDPIDFEKLEEELLRADNEAGTTQTKTKPREYRKFLSELFGVRITLHWHAHSHTHSLTLFLSRVRG